MVVEFRHAFWKKIIAIAKTPYWQADGKQKKIDLRLYDHLGSIWPYTRNISDFP